MYAAHLKINNVMLAGTNLQLRDRGIGMGVNKWAISRYFEVDLTWSA